MENYNYAYEITGFDKNPVLRQLTQDYVVYHDNENSDLSEGALWNRYVYLRDNNILNVLFESEKRGCIESEMKQNEAVQ